MKSSRTGGRETDAECREKWWHLKEASRVGGGRMPPIPRGVGGMGTA